MVPFNGPASSGRTDALPAGGSLHQESTGDPARPIATGWAQTRCNGAIKASILFRSYQQGVPTGEASVNAMTVPATKFVTFAGSQTGVAYANPSAQTATITITALSSTGTKLGGTSVTLPPGMHGASTVQQLVGLQNFAGSVQIVSNVPIVSLSLNFEAAPVFSSLPPGELDSSVQLSSGP